MWLVTSRVEMGNGVWVWREKDHVDQELGKSSLCCWPWCCAEKDLSGLRDSFLSTDPIVKNYPSFSSIAEVLLLWDYTFPRNCGPWHLTCPLYEAQRVEHKLLSLWWIQCSLGTTFLTRISPPTAAKGSISLSPVPWWFSPFSPSALDTSRASVIN